MKRRFTDLPAESRYSSKDWRWRVSTDHNDHGELLDHQFRMSRESRLRNGSYEYGADQHQQRRLDDLLTRGNGVVWLPPNFNSYFEYERPRKGNWALRRRAGSCTAAASPATTRSATASSSSRRYFISDAFSLYVGLYCRAHAGLAGLAAATT